jgi:DNA polymerase-1
MTASLVGISLAVVPGQGYYIPVGHKAGAQLPLEQVLSALSKTADRCPHTQDRA